MGLLRPLEDAHDLMIFIYGQNDYLYKPRTRFQNLARAMHCRCSPWENGSPRESAPISHPCGCGRHEVCMLWDCAVHWPPEPPWRHWRLKCLLEHLQLGTHQILLW